MRKGTLLITIFLLSLLTGLPFTTSAVIVPVASGSLPTEVSPLPFPAPAGAKKNSLHQRKSTPHHIRYWLQQQWRKKDKSGRIVLAILVSAALLFLLLVFVYALAYAGSGWSAVAAVLGLGLIIFLFIRIVRGRRRVRQ